ncbi:MAG TPA: hypothetical protein PLW80_09665, partial [Spirochaetales bacterium]|nr:hypothetical protein [Spirochaetales bacterium]
VVVAKRDPFRIVVGELLESIKRETNQRLASFCRIRTVEHHPDSFQKTPTQKIKRFLYPDRASSR